MTGLETTTPCSILDMRILGWLCYRVSYRTLPLYPTLSLEIDVFINSNCNFIIISTNCGLVAAKRHFTSINYDVIFSFDADRKLPTLCQQQNTFTLLLSVTIDATTTLLMSFGLGSFKFLDQNLTSGPEMAVIQKERKRKCVF